jgi:tape measure domain-containing protein
LETAGEENLAWVTQLAAGFGGQQHAAEQLSTALQGVQTQLAAGITAQQANATATQGATQALTQQTQAVTATGTAWQSILSIAGGVGIATSISAIVGQLKQFVSESVQLAIKMQSLTASFTAITGSSAGAQHALGFLRSIAVQTGTDFLTLAQSFKNFEAAARGTALEGTKAEGVFRAVTGAARVMGLSSADTGRALLALEQMVSKGTVSMEELRRQLGNALPGAFQIAARAMGTTTEGLQAMLKQGIESSDFVTRFGAQLQREFGPRLADAGQTAAATFGRLGNEVQAMATSVGASILTILTPVASFLESTLRKVRETEEAATRRAKVGLGGIPEGATEQEAARLLELQKNQDALRGRMAGGGPFPQFQGLTAQREQAELLAIQEQIKARKDLNATFARDVAPSPLPGIPFATEARNIQKEVQTLRDELKATNVQAQVFPAMSQDKLQNAKDTLKILETSLEKLAEQIAQTKDKAPGVMEDQKKLLATLNQEYAEALANVTKLEAAKEAETEATRKAAREAEKAARDNERRTRDSAKLLAEMGIAARLADTTAQAGGDPEAMQAAKNAAEEATLRQTIAEKGLGAAVEETAVAFLRQKQAADDSAATIAVMVKEQRDRIQELAKDLDIFGLNLAPDQEKALAFSKKIQDALAVAQAPKEERPETRLRALAGKEGIPLSPADEAGLRQLTLTLQEQAQAREMEKITTQLANNMRQTFDTLWEQVFTGGVTSFQQLGQVVVQSLQRMFAQLTAQIMNMLLNAASGTMDEKGGWEGALARGIVGVGLAALGGSDFGSDIPGMTNDPAVIGDLQSQINLLGTSSAGGNVFPGLGTIRMLAGGGIVNRPSFTTIAEMGQPEAVVPLSGGRSIPVEMRGQQPAGNQPIVIEIHNDYTNAVSPSALKTGKKEIIQHFISDYNADGPTRRTIKAG